MTGVNENGETQTDTGPTSIEDAMRRLRQGNEQPADTTVGNEGMAAGGSGEPESIQEEGAEENREGVLDSQGAEGSQQDDDLSGGSAAASQDDSESTESEEEQVDYESVSRAYIESTQKLAIEAANKLFRDNNVTKVSINDLYEKDERGRVSFNNPDDPDRPFQSRAEAQQWCDAFNAQIDAEWKRTVQNNQRGYMNDIQPMLRLMSFAPEFDAMSKKEQEVFDNIVEQYAIKDKTGMTIGYSCDLNNAKQVALNICKNFNEPEQQEKTDATDQKIQGGGPALDAKTSGTGNPQNEITDPKNIEEAMKLLNKSKKEKK